VFLIVSGGLGVSRDLAPAISDNHISDHADPALAIAIPQIDINFSAFL
tara:strand:+ start:579 stop:722 length:144 start_codon:yes stop_codon:yes gene_type:complete